MMSRLTINATNLAVSPLCYGTNMLGTAIDQDGANAILDCFAELGGNFLDTARVYGDWVPDAPAGASERAIGVWLKRVNRADFVIATKGGMIDFRAGDGRPRCTPADIALDLTQSLDHLGIDHVDLYWLHTDNPALPVEPIMDALLAHQAAGHIAVFGASNWSAARIAEANAYAASIGKQGFIASQTFWGLAKPDAAAAGPHGYVHYYEDSGYDALHAGGLTFMPYAAQSGGYFTKLAKGADHVPEGLKARYNHPANAARLAAAQALAARHGVTINEIILSYLSSQPHQTIPIFGARTPDQVKESVKSAALKLTAEELAQLRVG